MSLEDFKASQTATTGDPAKPISVREALDALQRHEAVTIPGAPTRTPKSEMLKAPDAVAKNPDSHLRWVSLRDPQKGESRKLDGYRRLTSEEGGKQIGDELVLMALPKSEYEKRDSENKTENARRLVAHKREMESTAEAVAKLARDRYGLDVSAESLMKP